MGFAGSEKGKKDEAKKEKDEPKKGKPKEPAGASAAVHSKSTANANTATCFECHKTIDRFSKEKRPVKKVECLLKVFAVPVDHVGDEHRRLTGEALEKLLSLLKQQHLAIITEFGKMDEKESSSSSIFFHFLIHTFLFRIFKFYH